MALGGRAGHEWVLVLSGFGVFGFELLLGWDLFRNPASEGNLDTLAFLMWGILSKTTPSDPI